MTGEDIYLGALALIGEEANAEAADTAAFRRKAPYLINLLIADLTPLNEFLSCRAAEGEIEVESIASLSDAVPLVPLIACGPLKQGLAFYLILEEDPERAAFFLRLYQESKASLRRDFLKGKRHSIRRVN